MTNRYASFVPDAAWIAFPGYWLRFIARPDACGLWNHNQEKRTPQDPPVVQDLRDEIAQWISRFEAAAACRPQGPGVWEAFVAEGRAIAFKVVAALRGWRVFYSDGTEAICRWPGLEIKAERLCAEIESQRKAALPKPPPPPPKEPFLGNWVRVMGDNCASGVWDRDGCNCDEDDLPVSAALRDRLRAWAEAYGDIDDLIYEQGYADWGPFAAEGLAIARAVKAELPDWTVFYFDESKACKDRSSDTYNYEILAETPEK